MNINIIKNSDHAIDFKKLNKRLDSIKVLQLAGYDFKDTSGAEHVRILCPFHISDKQKSFAVSKTKNIGFCHCCKKSYDLIDLYAQAEGLTKYEAAKKLDNYFNATDTKMQQTDIKENYAPALKDFADDTILVEQAWEKAKEGTGHPYLTRKKVKPPANIRYGKDKAGNDSVAVPYYKEGKLVALQYINNNIGPNKFFADGSHFIGSFYLDGDIESSDTICAGEGLATILTTREALGNKVLAASFASCKNMLPGIMSLRKEYPTKKIIVCLDLGKEAFTEALKLKEVRNCFFCWPSFDGLTNYNDRIDSKDPKDFNDLVSKCGQEHSFVQQQLANIRDYKEMAGMATKLGVTMPENSSQTSIDETDKQVLLETLDEVPSLTNDKTTDSANNVQTNGTIKSIGQVIKDIKFIDKINEKFSHYSKTKTVTLSGIATGYKVFDDLVDGLQPQHLIALAARTGMGKTWVALNLIYKISVIQDIHTCLFSLEMSSTQLLNRLVSLLTNINAKKIKRGQLAEEEFNEIINAIAQISQAPIDITDNPENSDLDTLIENLRTIHKEKKPELIIIDHIGLIHSKLENRNRNRVEEVGEITRRLKLTANELNIAIIQLVQLNRSADDAERPQRKHLRESGAIEQDSDIIIFIYRPDYYNQEKDPGIVELIVDKNREGEEGTVFFKRLKNSWLLEEINKPGERYIAAENLPESSTIKTPMQVKPRQQEKKRDYGARYKEDEKADE